MSLDMAALPHSNLNAFLFAAVGTEANGMALSVLSLLARLDLDPWQEAGRLADLSRTGSIEAMAGLIGSMPASPWPRAEAVPIATRLVGLLPRHVDAAAHPFPVHGGSPPRPATAGRPGRGPGQEAGIALTNLQWLGVLALLTVLFAGLAAGVVLHPTDEAAGADGFQVAKAGTAQPNPPGAGPQAVRQAPR